MRRQPATTAAPPSAVPPSASPAQQSDTSRVAVAEPGHRPAPAIRPERHLERLPAVCPGPQFATTVESATCRYPGVDEVTYQVFGSSTDLDTAYASILEGTRAKPSTDLPTACANGNWYGTWTREREGG